MYKGKRVKKSNGAVLFAASVAAVTIVCLAGIVCQSTDATYKPSVAVNSVAAVDMASVESNVAHMAQEKNAQESEPVQVCANPYDVPVDVNGVKYPEIQWEANLSDTDKYYLAKIVKCEAGICDMETKIRHALVILNRVYSDSFPDTVYDVITQHSGSVYQFSPVIPGGTWYKLEPDEECYEAVEYATTMQYDISHGATFFEATGSSNVWHQKALKQVCESDGVRFYTVW